MHVKNPIVETAPGHTEASPEEMAVLRSLANTPPVEGRDYHRMDNKPTGPSCPYCHSKAYSVSKFDTYYECGTHEPYDFAQQQSERCKALVISNSAEEVDCKAVAQMVEAGMDIETACKIIDRYKAEYTDNGIQYTEDDMCLSCSYDIADFVASKPSETAQTDAEQSEIELADDDRVEVAPEVQINPVAIIESRITTWNGGLVETLQNLANDARSITIAGHVNGEKAGCKVVRETRLRIRSQRLAIQNEAKAFADIGRSITRTAKEMEDQLIKIIEGEEKRLQREEDAYEARQDQIKREAEELQKQITASRWALMNELEVRPLDYNMCQTATEAIWDEYVEVWTENKNRADQQKAAEAEAKRIADEKERIEREAREADEKRIADEAKAKADAERAETEKALAAERAENAKLKAEMDAIKAKQKADDDARELERAEKEKAERMESARKQREADNLAREQAEREQAERDRPDLDKLNAWRLEVEKVIHSIADPELSAQHVKDAFYFEKKALYMAIPEIFPVVGV